MALHPPRTTQILYDVLLAAERCKERGFQVQLSEDGVCVDLTIKLPIPLLHEAKTMGGESVYDVLKEVFV